MYWDNAATTWPKPPEVALAVGQALRRYGANPGRAGHRMAMATAEEVYACRQEVAEFFGLDNPAGVIFTPNCTAALNTVIQGILGQGGRVIVSDLEHNAVVRPLWALPGAPRWDTASWCPNDQELVERFRRLIRPDTRMILCTHASNVFGVTLPIRKLGKLAHDHGLLFCVDAAQTAGVLPIDMKADHVDYLCVASHKGLYAPMGTGLLLCRERDKVPSLLQGGTGSYSLQPEQPQDLPDRLESGTPNVPGIIGLRAGLSFVKKKERQRIYRHEIRCLQQVYDRLYGHPVIRLYGARPDVEVTAPVLSLNVGEIPSEQVGQMLDAHHVAVRAGLHCAPWAHRRFDTLNQGTVRLAPSAFTTESEAEQISKLFLQIAEKSLH
ncbi:MAG: aminotransferase class V-fold PLP-dependent enzyme [Ruminococcaceae bacterium]|nr:aminotransferase class V-fold PLP-dependent enzyme [Oscillospiraceae bacterium]